MVRVKICGITNVEDALQATAAGADALGFVFYEASPRYVTVTRVQEILRRLPPFVVTVGLFVNEPAAEIQRIMECCGLDLAQLHGDRVATPQELWPLRTLPTVAVKKEESLTALDPETAPAWLLDSHVAGQFGGTGIAFEWQWARDLSHRVPIVLAGGLNPDNVADAVRIVRPYGVDVSSGVERSPGKKDPHKVAAFIAAAKEKSSP